MCAWCGDWTKPACDASPDCEFHGYGGEHDDVDRVFDDLARDIGRRLELQTAGQVPTWPAGAMP